MLTEIIRTGESAVEVGRRAGRRGRLGSSDVADPGARVVEQMAPHGFQPVAEPVSYTHLTRPPSDLG